MVKKDSISYSILDPTGNITALVESPVEICRQPAVAAELMERHREVEQVGFVRFSGEADDPPGAELRMAGGEFCGNASMSAAALCLIRREKRKEAPSADGPEADRGPEGEPALVRLQVSGARRPVEVRLWREGPDSFRGGVLMPPALGIEDREFSFGELRGSLPLVRMEGISHLVLEADSVFFRLKEDPSQAGRAVREWCRALGCEGLGLMFLEREEKGGRLLPLVYIPGSDTEFWENSCASGTSAVGMYLAGKEGRQSSMTFQEPGGTLSVTSSPGEGETWLYGHTRLLEKYA